ncbi:hypothetical protein HDU98_006292 [Podochytrium sp. JEL0797]|nr:hypothetical protein HDU98_006292 [Podochytrium sp. JEL0797]
MPLLESHRVPHFALLNLTKLSFLQPTTPQTLLLTREILELGAHHSLATHNVPAFERYLSQLQTYYTDYTHLLPPSQRQHPLLGLNLLRLLSQNRIAEFHTELERIDPVLVTENVYIKHPVGVEQSLMEGSYAKVWNSKVNVPAKEFGFFMDVLMGTIRNEIASCAEKAYLHLPLSDAATLLFLKDAKEVSAFASTRGWKIQGTQIVFEEVVQHGVDAIPAQKMVRQALGYARELERIV